LPPFDVRRYPLLLFLCNHWAYTGGKREKKLGIFELHERRTFCVGAKRAVVTLLANFLHHNNRFKLGGQAFCLSVIWSQIFPFIALQLFESDGGSGEEMKGNITIFLSCSSAAWLISTIAFFSTINVQYLITFFWSETSPEALCKIFLTTEYKDLKYYIITTRRKGRTKSIEKENKVNSFKQWYSRFGRIN